MAPRRRPGSVPTGLVVFDNGRDDVIGWLVSRLAVLELMDAPAARSARKIGVAAVATRSSPRVYERVSEDTLTAYLQRISRAALLPKEKELELATRIQQGDEKALKELVEANLRFVVKIALHYRGCGLSLLDLINEGNVGLLEAARRYSPTHNVKFITYAVWWIRQAIIQALASGGGAVRLPLRKARLSARARQAAGERAREAGLAPTGAEGAEDLEVGEGGADDARALPSLGQPAFFADDVALERRLGMELYETKELPAADHDLVQQSLREEVERMLMRLAPRERQVVELRFGLGPEEALTLQEVGRRLGLSRERIRQIERRAKQKLQVMARSRHLKDYLN